jgi:hypothetical protein
MARQHAKSRTQHTGPHEQDHPRAQGHPVPEDDLEQHARSHGFQDHTSLGIAGHFVHMGALLFPVLAAELIPSAETYRKAVRIGAVVTTVLYEGLHTWREAQRRQRQEEQLAECRDRE